VPGVVPPQVQDPALALELSVAPVRAVQSKQQELLETNQPAAWPSLAREHYYRAIPGVCLVPEEGKQQLRFLQRHFMYIHRLREQKKASAAHSGKRLSEPGWERRLPGPSGLAGPLNSQAITLRSAWKSELRSGQETTKRQGIPRGRLPEPGTRPLVPPSPPPKGEAVCFLVILALDAISSEEILTSPSGKAEPTSPHPRAPRAPC